MDQHSETTHSERLERVRGQVVTLLDERLERLVREPERERITGLSKTAWWRKESTGKAPRRILIDSRTIGWRLSDLQKWIEDIAAGREWRQVS